MKHKGCILRFTSQRNNELMAAYRKALASHSFIDMSVISDIVVNTPCSRFWVSEERAASVISDIIKGKPVLGSMRPLKREMFEDIYRLVVQFSIEYPDESLSDIIMRAVNSPAKKFYMKPRCAMEIIYKIKKGRYENKRPY